MESKNKDSKIPVKRSIDDPYVVSRLSFITERNSTNFETLFNAIPLDPVKKEKEKEMFNRFRN